MIQDLFPLRLANTVVRQSLVIFEWLLRRSAVARSGSATMFVTKACQCYLGLVVVLVMSRGARLSSHPRPSSVRGTGVVGPCRDPPVNRRVEDDSVTKGQPIFVVVVVCSCQCLRVRGRGRVSRSNATENMYIHGCVVELHESTRQRMEPSLFLQNTKITLQAKVGDVMNASSFGAHILGSVFFFFEESSELPFNCKEKEVDKTVSLYDSNCYWQTICSEEIVHRTSFLMGDCMLTGLFSSTITHVIGSPSVRKKKKVLRASLLTKRFFEVASGDRGFSILL